MKESSPIEEVKKRATIYARFSTDLQNERSIEDQLSLCQSYAEREGLTVVSAYEDRASDVVISALDEWRAKRVRKSERHS